MKIGDQEVYDGTAYYYLKYRGQYSKQLIRMIADICHLNGSGRLLDLGCGTGKLTFPLIPYFKESIGIDISSDMLQKAESQAELLGLSLSSWVRMQSEDLDPASGPYQLITSGDAFHWMDREKVLSLSYQLLAPGGALALVGQGHMLGNHSELWQQTVQTVITEWFGDKAGRPVEVQESHEHLLARSAFKKIQSGNIYTTRKRDIHSIIGYLYSTSGCHKEYLGNKAPQFERELTERLKEINPDGVFIEPVREYYIIAFKKG
ncbi:methyltransferase domain-containing protein [Sporolactobacillus spathodeae]|uniref:Cyclopropane fatty-acyl-phospholipid synthase-like methyltransferase n=1 Tax=Sporolactobacillus spathodeae TaxID=1465502 RepID=A0ABS2Q463_9BACL|nr:cyclopropane fatty-acyl-phospholipid synthase-like methyltransferase [Sporolactobacillus spathodeae]